MIRNKDINQLAEILKGYINSMDLTLEGIDGFYLNQFTKRYMLHILARMTHYIEEQSGINSNFADYVNREQKNPYDIEHIWADDYTQGNHQQDFSTEEEFKQFRNRFGGLLILPKDKNRSLQDMEYSKKVIKYDSENLLARTLNKNCYSNNPLFLRFMNETQLPFKPYDQFDKKALIERQSLYKEICKKIWDVNKIDLLANS
ncbi:MAG: HNH endonuclease [Clostridiales bacterium]|nr:HNH endonuclease [Clostridiales bacterium]